MQVLTRMGGFARQLLVKRGAQPLRMLKNQIPLNSGEICVRLYLVKQLIMLYVVDFTLLKHYGSNMADQLKRTYDEFKGRSEDFYRFYQNIHLDDSKRRIVNEHRTLEYTILLKLEGVREFIDNNRELKPYKCMKRLGKVLSSISRDINKFLSMHTV